ncbi:NYN domain-containing protein [Breznakiellaceae bacterium SP9]
MNVGILWDIENVTPPSDTNYIQAVLDKVSSDGKISYAMAFGNWNNNSIKNIASELAINNFELIHIPKSGKNSADMSLVAHGVELIFQYPHIDRYVLISGDADFRPLLVSQKKYGKETWVICDIKNNASEDLLKMADQCFDYRDIIGSDEVIEAGDVEGTGDEHKLSKEQAFELLKETIGIIIKEGHIAYPKSVKLRIKLLNTHFDIHELGYEKWDDFYSDAQKCSGVSYIGGILSIKNNDCGKVIPEIFKNLIEEIGNTNEWTLFNKLGERIDYKSCGYKKFKELALDAEKRRYVEIMNKGLDWYMKKI